MTDLKAQLQHKTWSKAPYIISTDPSLIPLETLNTFMSNPDFYWAVPMPLDILRTTLENSVCLGLYQQPDSTDSKTSPEFIGLARLITDFSTFAYLTDVYILPTYQGKGLGVWLINCVQEVIDSMPYLRRSLLFTSNWDRSVPFYERLMRMSVMEVTRGNGVAVMSMRGKAFPEAKMRGGSGRKEDLVDNGKE